MASFSVHHIRPAAALLACLLLAPATQGETVEIRDWTGRGFPADLVSYALPTRGNAWTVTDETGATVPSQVLAADGDAPRRLAWVACVPTNGTVRFDVAPRETKAEPDLTVGRDHAATILGNGLLELRLPPIGTQRFDPPRPLSEVAAPLNAFRHPNGAWLGASTYTGKQAIAAAMIELIHEGPVLVEARHRLDLATGGFHETRIQVVRGLPYARIHEMYDLGANAGDAAWRLDLTRGWTPTTYESASASRNGKYDRGRIRPLAQLDPTPAGWVPSRSAILPDNAFGAHSYLGLMDGEFALVGFLPIEKGWWRRFNAVELHVDDARAVAAQLPIRVRTAGWLTDGTSEPSAFSTQGHDATLPATLGRRAWALVLGDQGARLETNAKTGKSEGPLAAARVFTSAPRLDDYKDYLLAWKSTLGAADYPRLLVQRDTLSEYRKSLAADAVMGAIQARYFCVSGDEADAVRNLATLQRSLAEWIGYLARQANIGHGNGGIAVLALADDVLSWPGLPLETRTELRSKLALILYLTMDPGHEAWVAGTHLGNPNMPTGAYGTLPAFLALIPDHPMAAEWRRWMEERIAFAIGSNSAPGGGYHEYGTYGLHGYKNLFRGLLGLYALDAANASTLHAYNAAYWDYMLHALTPVDPLYRARLLPGDANGHPEYPAEFFEAVATVVRRDPQLAANLQWAWRASGSNRWGIQLGGKRVPADFVANENIMPLLGRPWIAPCAPALESRQFPGVGAFLRAQPHTTDEAYAYVRSGFAWSHWNANQGHLVFYANGVPLLPGQGYQYYGRNRADKPGVPGFAAHNANVVVFGHPENGMDYGWPDSAIVDAAITPDADYLWSSTGYPDWYTTPGRDVKWNGGQPTHRLQDGLAQTEGAFTADRQVLFVKGREPGERSYLVVRDTANGVGRLAQWWNLNLLGRTTDLTLDAKDRTLRYRSPLGIEAAFVFADDGALTLETAEDEPRTTAGMGYTGTSFHDLWKEGETLPPVWVDKDGKPFGPKPARFEQPFEQRVLVRMARPAGSEWFWVLYPLTPGEKPPRVERLADGVLRVGKGASSDLILLGPKPFEHRSNNVTFEGMAGIARAGAPLQVLGVTQAVELAFDGVLPVDTHEGPITVEAPQGAASERVRIRVADASYARVSVGTVAVRGCGPFDLTCTPTNIVGTVDGAIRTIACSTPRELVRTMYHMDGIRYLHGMADEPSPHKAASTPQLSLAFGVTAGPHAVRIEVWRNPGNPPSSPKRGLLH